ncbi:MAG: amidase [Microbacteriaceae bacterium]|nr:amidase [Microbacteriaceae bacterium]
MTTDIRPDPQRAAAIALAAARARIGADEFQAWVAVATDEQASACRPGAGPLAGLAFGVKDIIDLAGMPTRCGSLVSSDAPAVRSASFVDRIIDLGAVPVGKTATTEFAYFAPGPTRNPRAPGRTPGGSSSGSAAAVAAGHVPFALGSQTAGSTIRPAAFCGVSGLVLTRGAVPLDGFSGLASSLDAAGVLAPSATGLERIADAILPVAVETPPTSRVLVWHGDDVGGTSADMRIAVTHSAAVLAESGVTVERLDTDRLMVEGLVADHVTVMQYEVARERRDLMAWRDRLSPQLRELLERGAATPASDYEAALRRTRIRMAVFDEILGRDTLVLGPAAPGAAPVGLGATGSPVMSRAWQLLGVPQLAIAGNRDSAGLPLGVQLVARRGEERALLAAGSRLEAALVD